MKIFAKVQYLGTSFYGWQKQKGQISVQEEIEKTLSQILNYEVNIYGAGRTDAGVHAKGQTFHFELNKDFDLNKLKYAFNSLICDDIHLVSLEEKEEEFHARYSALKKKYCYTINLGEKNPFIAKTSLHYPYGVDKKLLKESLDLFIGKHDFRSFTSKEEDEQEFVREIFDIKFEENDSIIKIIFEGNGFMRYMIRNIVGTALAVSIKKVDKDYILNRLDNKNRDITSFKAKSEGLCLLEVIY